MIWIKVISLVLAIIAMVLVLHWDVKSDVKKWSKKVPVFHGKESRLRAVLLIPSFILFCVPLYIQTALMVKIIGTIVVVVLMVSWWSNLFDGLYSNARRFNWWHLGSNDSDDAKTDDFYQRLSSTQHKLVKIGGCAVSLGAYIYLFVKF